MTAQRLVAYEKGKVRLEEFEVKEPGQGEVLLEALYSAVSPGTELAWIHHFENTAGEYPWYPGYSTCGRVVTCGEGVTELKEGDVVVYRWMHCSHIVLDASICTKVPDGVSPIDASVYRLASIALQGIRKAQIQLGDKVAVIGLGPIGHLALQFAKAAGAGSVTGFDFVEQRRELALKCGADDVFVSAEDRLFHESFDVVIEASGAVGALQPSIDLAKEFGRVVLLGSTRKRADSVNFYAVHLKGLTLIGAHECRRAQQDEFGSVKTSLTDERVVMQFMGQGRLRSDLLVSEIAPVSQAQAVYDRLLKREEPLMLVVFEWDAN